MKAVATEEMKLDATSFSLITWELSNSKLHKL
jgi:hypothetical protein